MSPRYVAPWSMAKAARDSAALIRVGSSRRIVAIATAEQGACCIDHVTVRHDAPAAAPQKKQY